MKPWRPSQIAITATALPLVVLIGWWIYKQRVSKKRRSLGLDREELNPKCDIPGTNNEEAADNNASTIDFLPATVTDDNHSLVQSESSSTLPEFTGEPSVTNSQDACAVKASADDEVASNCDDDTNISSIDLTQKENYSGDTGTPIGEQTEDDITSIAAALNIPEPAIIQALLEEEKIKLYCEEDAEVDEQTEEFGDYNERNTTANDKDVTTDLTETVQIATITNTFPHSTDILEVTTKPFGEAVEVERSLATASDKSLNDLSLLKDGTSAFHHNAVEEDLTEQSLMSNNETCLDSESNFENTELSSYLTCNEEELVSAIYQQQEAHPPTNKGVEEVKAISTDQYSEELSSVESPLTSDSDERQNDETLPATQSSALNHSKNSDDIMLQEDTSPVNGINVNGDCSDNEKIVTENLSNDANGDLNANNNNSSKVDLKVTSITNGNNILNTDHHGDAGVTLSNSSNKPTDSSENTQVDDHTKVNGCIAFNPDNKQVESNGNGAHEQEVRKEESRTKNLPYLSIDNNNEEEEKMEVYVEFPSECVGLLIGKMGRNIKQLKLDSGADVFVHTEPTRTDIQVLQICGTQAEVESCVSRIKRRFHEISLTPYDGNKLSITSPTIQSGLSPVNTPPPGMYPVSNISKLRLPEGVNVEVTISAIAAVDCIFLQQYTHPTFHNLDGLERAMALCYAEPSTPGLPNPVQAGLICAAPQQGVWYRAQIMNCFEETDEILIQFLDYGGYATLPRTSLKQIRADLVSLPFQAVECYLDHIAPAEDHQAFEETVAKVAEILAEGRFQARITGYNNEGHPKIHLYKCTDEEVVLVNRLLATEGLATWIEADPYQDAEQSGM